MATPIKQALTRITQPRLRDLIRTKRPPVLSPGKTIAASVRSGRRPTTTVV